MELKTARLTLLIDPNKKAAFEQLCAAQDRTPSQVVRQLIRDYLAEHGVSFQASGAPAKSPRNSVRAPPATASGRAAPSRAPRPGARKPR